MDAFRKFARRIFVVNCSSAGHGVGMQFREEGDYKE